MQDETHSDVLDHPQLTEVLQDDNQLRLSPLQLETAIEKSREYWYRLTTLAVSRHHQGILPSHINPRHLLGRVPAICGSIGHMLTSYSDSYQGRVLCIKGFSTWKVTNSSCELRGEKIVPGLLQIGSQKPVPCRFGGDEFGRWPGNLGEEKNAPNYLGVLALGWSYILSARLGEILGNDTAMTYTSATAMVFSVAYNEDIPNTLVDIGEVTEDACRWWAAILAPFEGWKAIISWQDNQEYLAPWSISIKSSPPFGIRGRVYGTLPLGSARTPPSSSEAFRHLSQFALRHNLASQFSVALTTAMTFPTHSTHRTVVQLPLPIASEICLPSTLPTSVPPEWMTLEDELPFYMALSCSPEVVISSLCGMFWEPGVTCNMVSPWLHPILNEVPFAEGISGTRGFYYEFLAIICSFRQPRIYSLWLGAVASGLTPVILRRIRRGRPPLDANAFPWTGCPQSFMDVAGNGLYRTEGSVQRADVWRLLHLPPVVDDDLHYDCRPSTPWAPPGSMIESSCALRVRSHLLCGRHTFQYQKWTWKAENGTVIEDQGFSKDILQSLPSLVLNFCVSLVSSLGRRTGLMRIYSPSLWLRAVQLVSVPNLSVLVNVPFKLKANQPDLASREIATVALEIPRKPFDQEASEEASLDIFRWVTVNGEGVPDEKIYKHDWLQYDDDEDDDNEELPVSSEEDSLNPALKVKHNIEIKD